LEWPEEDLPPMLYFFEELRELVALNPWNVEAPWCGGLAGIEYPSWEGFSLKFLASLNLLRILI